MTDSASLWCYIGTVEEIRGSQCTSESCGMTLSLRCPSYNVKGQAAFSDSLRSQRHMEVLGALKESGALNDLRGPSFPEVPLSPTNLVICALG